MTPVDDKDGPWLPHHDQGFSTRAYIVDVLDELMSLARSVEDDDLVAALHRLAEERRPKLPGAAQRR